MGELEKRRRIRASDSDRDEILHVLQEAHVAGRLTVEEIDERQAQALEARYVDELEDLVDDLPEAQHRAVARAAGKAVSFNRRPSVPTRVDEPRRFSVTVMSGTAVHLEPGSPGISNFAWWGGNDIYVADAMGPENVVVLELSAIMAGHDVYVPPGVRVIDESIAIMAGNDIHPDAQGDGSNGTVIIRGLLWWAGHDVKIDTRHAQNQGA